jgi:hypothetical protein
LFHVIFLGKNLSPPPPLSSLPDVVQLVTGNGFKPPDMKQYLLPFPSALKVKMSEYGSRYFDAKLLQNTVVSKKSVSLVYMLSSNFILA